MWDWLETLGRTAMRAAPYALAPFTGGASLFALPAANYGADTWGRSDINQGEGQQGFERWASPISNIAAIAAPYTGGYGLANLGSRAATTAGGVPVAQTGWGGLLGNGGALTGSNAAAGGWQNTLGNILNQAGPMMAGMGGGGGNTGSYAQSYVPQQGIVMPRGGFNYMGNPLNQLDQSNPNLAMAMHQGRQEALANQPFRQGYISRWIGKDTEGNPVENFARMPAITPNVRSERRSERQATRQQSAGRRVSRNY